MSNEDKSIIDPRVYEIAYILIPSFSEEEAQNKANSLKESIATLGGSFISEEAPYMRELSYEMTRVIKNVNHKFNEGYFGWIKFEMTPDIIKTLEKQLFLDEDIIRFLLVKANRDINIYTKKVSLKREIKEDLLDEDIEVAAEVGDLVDVVEEGSSEDTLNKLN